MSKCREVRKTIMLTTIRNNVRRYLIDLSFVSLCGIIIVSCRK